MTSHLSPATLCSRSHSLFLPQGLVRARAFNGAKPHEARHATLRRHNTRAQALETHHELIGSEEDFKQLISDQRLVIVDWMAKWCRKCIYLKPKLEKLLHDEYPGLPLVFVDVNAVPGDLVYGHGIRKMPTITIHKQGEKVREHIAAEQGLSAITNIRSMIQDYMEMNPDEAAEAKKK